MKKIVSEVKNICYNQTKLLNYRAGGEIGKHIRLRSVWGNPWGFKSPPAHQYYKNRFVFVREAAGCV